MIEHDALELLQSTAVKAAGINRVPNTDRPTISVPKGIKLEDIEHLQAHRHRFRGKYATNRLSEFCTYVTNRVSELQDFATGEPARSNTSAFLDIDRGTAKAIFNLGRPGEAGHGDDVALLDLAQTAAYNGLLKLNGIKLSQKDLAEWLEDWAQIIEPFYGEDEQARTLKQAIAAVRNIRIKADGESTSKVNDFGASKTALESIEASSQDQLPAGFLFHCSPYPGFIERQFRLRLSVITDQTPKLVVRLVGHEEQVEKIGQEFEEIARDKLPEAVRVYRGSFAV